MNQAFPYGNQYQPTRCNGADYTAVPETAPTGSLAMCVAEHPNNGQIFDLSGNVREWVLSRVQPESFELRGGAYNVVSFEGDAPGLKCSSAIPAPANVDVRLPSVGFRCCRSGRLPAQ
jgi:formylglycine-generating enzyme required for sulfatase activity